MRVLLRCDGGGSLGVGHVMRSLALAEAAVAAGHHVVVAGRFEGTFLQRQLAAAPVEVVRLPGSDLHPAAAAAAAAADPERDRDRDRDRDPDHDPDPDPADADEDADAAGVELGPGPDWLAELFLRFVPDVVHVDSYESSESFRGSFVLSNLEDGRFGRRPADVVIDPTLGAELTPRPEDGSSWVLRGSRYTPLRQRVIDARRPDGDEPSGGSARSVLVVMGGTDPAGVVPVAVELLVRTGLDLDVTAIAVGENAERARAAARGSGVSLAVLAPVDDLAGLMSGHDLVVSAAGTSLWELCCLGVPAAVVWTVDNQREGYRRVVEAGAALGLGGPGLGGPGLGGPGLGGPGLGGGDHAVDLLRGALTDSQVRRDLSLAGRRLLDPLGAWRVVQAWETARRQSLSSLRSELTPATDATDVTDVTDATHAGDLVTRPATLEDARELWRWRNDPVTQAGSRSSAEVPWADHLCWLTASLARTDRVLLMVEDPAVTAVGNPGSLAAVGTGTLAAVGNPGSLAGVGAAGTLPAVGTARWDRRPTPEGQPGGDQEWEVSVTVSPERRGQSLSGPLLRAAEVALTEVLRSRGTRVTAYLAAVHVENRASVRLFETSAYVPDLPPDAQGFMLYRKAAPVL